MDLATFLALVDSGSVQTADQTVTVKRGDLLIEVRNCFSSAERDQALVDVRQVIADLGLRYLCDQASVQSYLQIALVLQHALKVASPSNAASSDWEQAIQLAKISAAQSGDVARLKDHWVANERASALSTAIQRLRALGYRIDLPDSGGFKLVDADRRRLQADIDNLAASLGFTVAYSAAGKFKENYSAFTGRFRLGRTGATIQINSKPQIPVAYLYQLGLRYFDREPTTVAPEADWTKLVDLLTNATALQDLSVNSLELMHASPIQIESILQRSIIFDSTFLLTQLKPAHAREYLEWLLSSATLAVLKDKEGRCTREIRVVASNLLHLCQTASHQDFLEIYRPSNEIERWPKLARHVEILRDVFTHPKGANQGVSYPIKDTDVDAAFKPLVEKDHVLWMQPPPLAARAIVNATLEWCRSCFSKRAAFDEQLGLLIEAFVRQMFAKRNVSVMHGKYSVGPYKGECDAVLETQSAIIFFEFKGKTLTRTARSGDMVTALADLAQAVVRPMAQAMERHAVIKQYGTIVLKTEASSSTIELGNREVLKVSVTRGDLNSLHDRPFLLHFLNAGCYDNFESLDKNRKLHLKDLNKYFRRFRDASRRAGEIGHRAPLPFERCWSLSVFYLLLLLDNTTDNESFGRELLRARRSFTPLRDFYAEYEFLRDLQPG